MSKKITIFLLGIIAVLGLAACSDLSNEVSGYYVAVDINPSIEFIVDENDNVESYLFLNEDAELLCVDLDFTGMNIDDAVELFVQTATEAGYIDPEGEDNAVLITVLGEEDEEEQLEGVRKRIKERVLKHFKRQFINALVLSEDYSQEDLIAEAEELGVTPGKLKIAKAAMLGDETLVLEDLLEIPVKDILSIVRDTHQDEWQEYRQERVDELRQRKRELIEEHKAVIEAYKEANPELSEEELDQWIEEYKETVRQETKEEWQQRREEWRNNRQNKDNEQEETE